MNNDKVLRASKAGFPCLRNLFYSVNGYEAKIDKRTQRIFEVGTYLEPLVVKWLQQEGWQVDYNPGSQNADFEVSVPITGGMLAGHPDAFISKGELQNVLIDIKTMNDRAFTFWRREGSIKSKPQYVIQLHIYALGCINAGRNVEHLGIVGVNKNNSDWHIDLFDFNENTAELIKDTAQNVFSMTQPPEVHSPSEDWACSYCEFSETCSLHSMPETAQPILLMIYGLLKYYL